MSTGVHAAGAAGFEQDGGIIVLQVRVTDRFGEETGAAAKDEMRGVRNVCDVRKDQKTKRHELVSDCKMNIFNFQLNALVLQLIFVKLQITNYVKRNFIHFRKAWFTKTDQ